VIERKEQFAKLEAEVLLVAYDELSLLQAKMLRGVQVPFRLLLDHDKEAYRSWGMGRTTPLRSFLSPVLSFRYLKLLWRGEPFLGLAPDMLQLGGDFIIDREGRITFAHPMKDNGDRAPVERLIQELHKCGDPDGVVLIP
jgi:peroxiredoxin